MFMNLANLEDRQRLIIDLNSENTKARKQWSLRSSEVQGGRIQQYVKESLEAQFNIESVKEMPIVSSINIQRATVDKKATIYKKPAERIWTNVSNSQTDTLKAIYKDLELDKKLNMMNKNYIYQDQAIGMIIPKGKKYIARIFKMHQIDAIVDPVDPESALGYIISAFDRTDYIQKYQDMNEIDTATGVRPRSVRSSANEVSSDASKLADDYQYRKYVMKYIVWTKQYNFMMNGLGEILDSESGEVATEIDIASPLASENILPFFEVSKDKDFEYFVRPSNTLTDFTVQFNVALSDLQNNCKLNGYSVGVLKAPSSMQPQNLVIGAAMLIKLSTDEPDKEVDFSFANPSSSIGEISDAVDRLLNYFTTSAGLGGEVINSQGNSEKYTSGLDRFIASLSRVEAHIDDYEKFSCMEKDIYKIILAWNRVLSVSDLLDSKYKLGKVSTESDIEVNHHKPQMIESEAEKLSTMEKKIDLGLLSKAEALMDLRGLKDKEQAKKLIKEIQDEKAIDIPINFFEEENNGRDNRQSDDNKE